jgi:hypothetical protein
MMFVMAAHAMLGCCWHHAHAAKSCSEHAAAKAAPDADHQDLHLHECSLHSAAHRHAPPPTENHAPADSDCGKSGDRDEPSDRDEPCDDADCVFVRTDSGQTVQFLCSHSICIWTATDTPLSALGANESSCRCLSRSAHSAPHLRAHLLLQVLLI